MEKIISIAVLLFIGLFASAQTSGTVVTKDSLRKDSLPAVWVAEEMPHFPGGQDLFYKYLNDSLRYPQIEKQMEKQGTVYVTFTVEADGSITNVKMAKEIMGCPGFSKEAIRVISGMPKWSPGKKDGVAVRTTMTMPVKFVLKDDPKPEKKKKKQ